MTVIRGKQIINYPSPNSVVASDSETLSVGSVTESDTESLNNEPQRTNRILVLKPPSVSHVEELKVKKNAGRKKLRRYHNRSILQTLDEEDEKENYVVVMEAYKGPFTRLLEDEAAMEYWNDFIEKSEEEQTKIVKALSEKYCNHSLPDCSDNPDSSGRISSRIRRTFKIRKNLCLETVQGCEEDLIAFFKARPEDIYVKFPPTSFDRLLIHGIAQYHRLKSTIQMSPEERQVRIQELMTRIAEKERELSQLEEQRRNMLSNYDASVSSAGSGPAFTPPARAARQRGPARRLPRSPYQQTQRGCAAGCGADCSMSTTGETSYQHPAAWRQRRIMSTPERRSARPPAFDTSGYNTSNGPGGCDPSCRDPCHTMDETMDQWNRRLM